MVHNVVFLHQAELDLIELKRYITTNFSQTTWQTSYKNIKKVINGLKKLPEAGHIPPELDSLNLTQYRQVISGKNRIIYEIRGIMIYIHIVCDARQDMATLLFKRLLRHNITP